ncbi:KRAB-A domain-containing protein 2-like [Gossypium australe]|uniref:KRAB-A domain-containing protein 2-like n=1 Tax=Gossypium australe TaxID=47621 RepID=A0A5B6UZW7_9ROSI|nr:KRAB-A domain-containing protein 2-like [Gossypium australe]
MFPVFSKKRRNQSPKHYLGYFTRGYYFSNFFRQSIHSPSSCYFSKWVEAVTLPPNDTKSVVRFLRKNMFTRFSTPRVLVNDKGSEFCSKKFEATLAKYRIRHRTKMAYHPQANGQVEASNCEIKQILEKTVNPSRKDSTIKLDDALWAYKIIYKTPLGMSPYKLIYDENYHLPIELEKKKHIGRSKSNSSWNNRVNQKRGIIFFGEWPKSKTLFWRNTQHSN